MFIGVLDSGLGGLSVERWIRRLMPSAAVRYVADQAHAPYGEKPPTEIRARAELISDQLIEDGAAAVVLACNSASAAALHHLRGRHPDVPFVGMEPAVKPAAQLTRSGVVGVLATTATVEGVLLARVIADHGGGVNVISTPCPGWVEMIEDGLAGSAQAEALVAAQVTPLVEAGADTLVLACTHFPFVREAIQRAAPDATLIDPGEAVARQVARVIEEVDLAAETEFFTTGDPVRFRRQLAVLLDLDAPVSGYGFCSDRR